jgi:hypothetical protein
MGRHSDDPASRWCSVIRLWNPGIRLLKAQIFVGSVRWQIFMNVDPWEAAFNSPMSFGSESLGVVQRTNPNRYVTGTAILKCNRRATIAAKTSIGQAPMPPFQVTFQKVNVLLSEHDRRAKKIAEAALALAAMAIAGTKREPNGLITDGSAETTTRNCGSHFRLILHPEFLR